MTLQAVLFDLNGTIANTDGFHQPIVEQLLLAQNLRPEPGEYRALCPGRSDRACLSALLARRGRSTTADGLDGLLAAKSAALDEALRQQPAPALYPDVAALLARLDAAGLAVGVVAGMALRDAQQVLAHAGLSQAFAAIASAEEAGDPYTLALARLSERSAGSSHLIPSRCLAIEATETGIAAAHRAGLPVAAVTHRHPLHMLQRQADWAIDRLGELELERLQQAFAQARAGEC